MEKDEVSLIQGTKKKKGILASILESLPDLLAAGAEGYAQGAGNSNIPEAAAARGFSGGFNRARELSKQQAVDNSMSDLFESEEFKSLSPSEQAAARVAPKAFFDARLSGAKRIKLRLSEIRDLKPGEADREFDVPATDAIAALKDKKSRKRPVGIANGKIVLVDDDGNIELRDIPGGKSLDPVVVNDKPQKPPSGFRFTPDGNLEVVPGGPASIKEEERTDKKEGLKTAAMNQADLVVNKVDQALKKVGFFSAGIGTIDIRGLPARDLKKDIDTIKANLGFAELAEMRRNSPTGGALGQVAVQELAMLQATVASLDQDQSPEQLKNRLLEIKKHYQNWKNVSQQEGAPTQGGADSFGFVIGQQYPMKDGNTATYIGNGEFE